MPDVDGVLEIEVIDQFGEIVGVMVHVVAVPRLTGTAMYMPPLLLPGVPAGHPLPARAVLHSIEDVNQTHICLLRTRQEPD